MSNILNSKYSNFYYSFVAYGSVVYVPIWSLASLFHLFLYWKLHWGYSLWAHDMLHNSHLYYDMTRFSFLILAAEFSQNTGQHLPLWCYFLLTLLKPGQTTSGCEALPKSHQEHRHLKDALVNSVCRITSKSTRLQSALGLFDCRLASSTRECK